MTDEMKNAGKGILCCLIIAALFIACSESITNPATPGSGLFSRDVVIKSDTLFPTSDTTFLHRIAPDANLFSPLVQNFVGKNNNFMAYTALRFYPVARDTINVLSAKLTLRLVTWSGDSAGTFALTAHKIVGTWDQTTLTWPIADSSGFYEAATRGTYSSSLGPDTQKITFSIDTAMVREWYRSGVTSYGFLLKPASGCTIIRGIHAFDFDSTTFWPQLEVIAQGTSGTAIPDTTTLGVGADTYVAEVSPFNLSPDHLFTQAGIVYRSKLKFDASRIPRGSIINSAELLLQRDPALTKTNKFSTNSQPGVFTLADADSTHYEATGALGAMKSGDTFGFDVRRPLQLWVNGSNYGLLLRQPDANEFGTLDVFSFYSNEAVNAAQRPRIVVTYTMFQ